MKRMPLVKVDCENPDVKYLRLFGRRYVCDKRMKRAYRGWYKP